MSNINLRLYSEQVYGLSSSFLNEYISLPIEKESFNEMFKNGLLKYENINTKKEIILHPTLSIKNMQLNALEVNIPDENSSLVMNIQGIKTELFFSEISENKLEEIIISEKKELREKFIKDLFIKITKKTESASFIQGLLENIIKKIINGMKITIKNFEILAKFKNFEFLIKLANFDLVIENKELQINFNDFSISYNKNIANNDTTKKIEENIINKTNINIKLTIKDHENKNEENKESPQISDIPCQLKIITNNISINISENILKSLFEIINLYRNISYNKIFQRYKKLIFFHKPKKLDENNKNYRLLWLYAINTVIKLRKYNFCNNLNIFELLNSTQNKIINKNTNNENEDYILLNDLNILYSTKNIVEKKILDSKESLANKFFSFFSSNKSEEKSLTSEEKEMLEDAYKDINLEKYIINRNFEENSTDNNENELIKKIKKYILNFDINANIENINIFFNNNLNNDNNIFLKNISFYLKNNNNNFNFIFNTQDIGKNENESFCKDIANLEKGKNDDSNYLIKIEYDNNKLNFNLGKKVEMPENILYFIICYINYIIQSITTFGKRYIFKNNSKKELNKSDTNLEIKIPYLPSFTLLTNDNNKINVEISEYAWNDELISFKIKINDLKSILIDSYQFSISMDKTNKKYTINLEKPLNINIDKQMFENLIINYKNINNSIFIENNDSVENKLFNFTFTKEINTIGNTMIFNNNINIIINEANIILKDKENNTSIKLKNINFNNENKALSLTANEIFLEYDLLSLQPIINELNKINKINTPINSIYKYNYINMLKEITKDIKIDINHLKGFFYIEHKNYYINLITKGIKGYNDTNNNQIINFIVNDINMNWVYVPDTLKIIDSKNITLNARIDQDSNLAFKLFIDSPIISLIFLVYNFQDVTQFIKNFFKVKVIYEIKITNIKTEIYEAYLNTPDEKIESGITINLTNYKKIKENNQIDLMNLEKYGLTYKLESYTDLIFGLNGKNLKFFGSQRDVSFLFFSVLKPSSEDEKDKNENNSKLLTSIDLDVNFHRIKVDFHLEKSYDIVFFDFHLGNLLLNLNVLNGKITNYNLALDKIQMNYYENNINNNKRVPITILNYEIPKENSVIENIQKEPGDKKQIEIKKDLNNKTNIIINKINLLFIYDVMLSIFYYFNDISVFDLLSNFIKNIKENKNLEINEKEEKNTDIQIIFSEIQFQFPLNYFGQNNCIYLYFNQFDFTYLKIVNNSKIDQSFRFSLNNIILKNNKRNLIFSKDEYLLLVLNLKKNINYSIISNALFNSLTINLSNKDIIIFYKIILDILKLNQIIIEKNNTNLLIKENSIDNNNSNNRKDSFIYSIITCGKINSIISEINIESINITLLDDSIISSENIYNYFPFLNTNLYKIKFKYEHNKIINEKYPDIAFNSNFNVLVNYYNDNIKIWEPLTEDLIIKLDYIIKNENNHLIDNYTFEINKLNLNISDEFLNILLIKLNNWLYELTKQYKYTKAISKINKIKKLNDNTKNNESDNILLKYVIHNYTDLDLTINYENKKYILNKSKKLNIENNNNEGVYEFNNNTKFIILEYNNNDKNNKILLFGEDFGIKQFKLNIDGEEREFFIETKVNKEKYIDILIVNPIIIKNNTDYSFKMELNEGKENKPTIINLLPNSIVGLPINYIINTETNFKLELNKDKSIQTNSLTDLLYLKDLISDDLKQKINKDIIFKINNICLSLISKMKLEKYRELIISHKYCIINCLPCSLYIPKNTETENDDNVEIKKNSLFNIDDTSLLIQNNQRSSIKLKIKIADNYFYSKLSLMRNETKKLIKFTSSNNKETIILPILIKETFKTKAIIIYSEDILYNNSGIELNISSQDENNINYFYNIGNNIFLISYDIKKTNSYICLKSNKNIFITNYIKYDEIKNEELFEFSLNIEDKLNTNQYNFDLIINKNISNLWCENDKNNIIKKIKEEFDLITIYRIIPKYNIINYTKENKKENKINLIIKQNKKYYLGINIKNYEEIKEINDYYMFDNLVINSLYTICIGENLYNVEVKKAKKGGYKDIFIFNNNLKYSQVLVENKTNYDICLKQKKYEKYKQIVPKNQTQILKIYEQSSHNFSAQIDNKLYYFNLNEIEKKHIINNLYLNIEQNLNRNSKKIIFYIENKNDDFIQKSKSVMDLPKIIYNRFKMNFTHEKYLKINIILNHINISMIGQNNKSNNDYERKEIALFFIDDFQCGIKLRKSKSIYEIKLNVKISDFQTYNLLMNNISCLFENTSSPLINIYSEISYDINKNRIRITELVNKIGDIRLNIVPIFLKEAYLFIKNIIINMQLNNQIIDNIFLTNNRRNKNIINFINNIKTNNHPLSIIIDKIDISDIKIRFKLNGEGIETLPKVIIDFIEYLKCFPFFAIDKETKTILGQIYLEGPFKDIKILIDNLKYTIITQLSKEIVIKVLHPSANEIKDNINNMMGYENKIIHKNTNDEKIMRTKYKRIFFGKNQFFKKYNKNEEMIMQRLKDDLKQYKDKYIFDIIYQKNYLIILFDDFLLYVNNNDKDNEKNIIYKNIKNVECEKNKIIIKWINSEDKDTILEFPDENITDKIYKFLMNFSNN